MGSKVVNLSNFTLSTAELSLLDKGLTFIPQSFTTGTKQLQQDFDAFARRLRIQCLYHDCPNRIYDPFRLKSKRPYLNSGNTILETYINNTKIQLHQLNPTRPKRDNPSPSERQALAKLQKRSDIIIKADKGNCVTVEDTNDYIRAAEEYLSDETKYEKLPFDTTDVIYDKIQATVLSHYLRHNLTRTQFEYVSRPKEYCRTHRFTRLRKSTKIRPK